MKSKQVLFQFTSDKKGNVKTKFSNNFKTKHIKVLVKYFFELSKKYNDDRELIESKPLDIILQIKHKQVINSEIIDELTLDEVMYLINECVEIFDKLK